MNSGESYEIKVQDAEQIDPSVRELHLRSEKEGLTRVFLDHEEDLNVVRGYGEPFRHTENDEITEVRRRDGGLSWYHDNTKCFMLGIPAGQTKMRQEHMNTWGDLVIQELEDLGYPADMKRDGSYDVDIYHTETGRQLVGLSGSANGSLVFRACWYEEEPEIEELLEPDNEDVNEFYDSFEVVPGLYDRLQEQVSPETVNYGDFVSKEVEEAEPGYHTREDGYIMGSCINGLQKQTS